MTPLTGPAGGDELRAVRHLLHELNNALAPVIGFADLLADGAGAKDPDQVKRYAAHIQDAALDALRISAELRSLLLPDPLREE